NKCPEVRQRKDLRFHIFDERLVKTFDPCIRVTEHGFSCSFRPAASLWFSNGRVCQNINAPMPETKEFAGQKISFVLKVFTGHSCDTVPERGRVVRLAKQDDGRSRGV